MAKPSKMQQRLAMGKAGRNAVPRSHGFISARQMSANEVQAGIALRDATHAAINAPKRVIFMSRQDAAQYEYTADDVLISISDTGVLPPAFVHQPQDIVALAFHDHVDYGGSNLGHRWMIMEDGNKIADFVLKHTDKRNIIVHCNYGESRSRAVAMAIHSCMSDRAVLRVNDRGNMVAVNKNDGKGNSRVGDITMHSLLSRSEGEDD